jgi:NAD(P)-dependent dehydrogenase (short-subunit alcohol dehydrogenase family)
MSTKETTQGENKFEEYPEKIKPEIQDKEGGPGIEAEMETKPYWDLSEWMPSDKLKNKVALITGGDSGIGRAVATLFAKEGCDVSIVYRPEEQEDAETTKKAVEAEKRKCLLLPGDMKEKDFCFKCVKDTFEFFGKLDILINHAGMQEAKENFEDVSQEIIEETFQLNVFSHLYFTQAAIPYLKEGSTIINTTSVNAYVGHDTLVEYTSTKGANRAFTYSMAKQLAKKGIRVNGVAPGPIWTPLIVSTFPKEKQKRFGSQTLLERPGQPEEVAPCYLFLACNQMSSYITGSILHPNGGMSTDS